MGRALELGGRTGAASWGGVVVELSPRILARYAAALARIKAKIRRRFPIGTTVRMNRRGEQQFPRYAGKRGKVVGYSSGVSPKVLWEHRRTADGWHEDFLTVVRS